MMFVCGSMYGFVETFLFVFYAGHGLQDNYCFTVCNVGKIYPLEK